MHTKCTAGTAAITSLASRVSCALHMTTFPDLSLSISNRLNQHAPTSKPPISTIAKEHTMKTSKKKKTGATDKTSPSKSALQSSSSRASWSDLRDRLELRSISFGDRTAGTATTMDSNESQASAAATGQENVALDCQLQWQELNQYNDKLLKKMRKLQKQEKKAKEEHYKKIEKLQKQHAHERQKQLAAAQKDRQNKNPNVKKLRNKNRKLRKAIAALQEEQNALEQNCRNVKTSNDEILLSIHQAKTVQLKSIARQARIHEQGTFAGEERDAMAFKANCRKQLVETEVASFDVYQHAMQQMVQLVRRRLLQEQHDDQTNNDDARLVADLERVADRYTRNDSKRREWYLHKQQACDSSFRSLTSVTERSDFCSETDLTTSISSIGGVGHEDDP